MSKMGLPMAMNVKGMVKSKRKLAKGGFVSGMDEDNSPVSIADELRRRAKESTPNDQADLDENNDEDLPFDFDDMNEEAADDLYDVDDEIEDQPRDSNLKGGSIADRIRRKSKK